MTFEVGKAVGLGLAVRVGAGLGDDGSWLGRGVVADDGEGLGLTGSMNPG
jgi:hypothetical protein